MVGVCSCCFCNSVLTSIWPPTDFLGGGRFYVPAQPKPRQAVDAVKRAFRIEVEEGKGDLDAAFYALRQLQVRPLTQEADRLRL